ncbi:MAG: choline dehydrogenase, partial [Pelagibacteraceae bacterium]|nr:choline dehydrogenase [Pelagibacteraceae bacterium]
IFCPRGKMIGGCSSHNGMVFVRGNPMDFERWASYGLPKWSYKNVLPYFKKLETWSGGENLYRGGRGPLKVNRSRIDDNFPLFKSLIKAAAEAGIETFEDSNGYKQDGFGTFDVTIDGGIRQGVARAYLEEIKNYQNVLIKHNTDVSKIIFEGKIAKGVEITKGEKKEIYYANKEVILSAGSINSPKILQLSGIGDSAILKENGIDVVKDLPGVGKNLQDHLEIYIQHKSKRKETLFNLSTNYITQAIEGIKWFVLKKGMLTYSHLEVGGFVKTSDKYLHPNIQFHFFPSLVINHGLTSPSFDGFQFHASPNRPKSKGFVNIKSNDFRESPKIQFNYLEDEEDLQQMRDSVKIANNILTQPSMEKYLGDQIRPGKDCPQDELDNIIRDTADTAYHPSCTNKMGIDHMSVVDEAGKVYGIGNLRIIDSSIMPDILSGNLNAGTIMIAEKISDMILGNEEEVIDAEYYS